MATEEFTAPEAESQTETKKENEAQADQRASLSHLQTLLPAGEEARGRS